MDWDRVLPTAVVVALVEGVILGYVFSAFSGAGFVLEYWALMALICGSHGSGRRDHRRVDRPPSRDTGRPPPTSPYTNSDRSSGSPPGISSSR